MKGAMKWTVVLCIVALLGGREAQAVVALAGTRLVFDGQYREATIEVSNPGSALALIQAWIDGATTGQPANRNLPFVLTPHLVQIPAQGRQLLRVLYQGRGMPTDRESLLHLYVLEVPRRSEAMQQLNIAVRQRINVFYRPPGLADDPAQSTERLVWMPEDVARGVLKVRNPTPFHVALLSIVFNGTEISEDLMLEPFSEHVFQLPENLTGRAGQGSLGFKALTDYGGQRDFCADGIDTRPFTARLRAAGAHSHPPHSLIGKC